MLNIHPPFCATFCQESENPDAVHALQRLRKELFVDHLGWRLGTCGDREVDQFDTAFAVHCLVRRGEQLLGGFRAIPSCYPYLAQSVFPHMATLRPFPRRPDVWEISRFGILPIQSTPHIARLTYAVMLQFARLRRAKSLVALVDLSHERLLRHLGIATRRYGPPAIVGLDQSNRPIHAVAGEIPLTEQHGESISQLMSAIDNVEISDETLVFGRWAISA